MQKARSRSVPSQTGVGCPDSQQRSHLVRAQFFQFKQDQDAPIALG